MRFYCTRLMKPSILISPKLTENNSSRPLTQGTQQCNTHQRGFPAWGAHVWSRSKHMSHAASGPHKCSTVKSWRHKTKFPHLAPAHQPKSSFLFRSLPLLQRAQRLLSGRNQSPYCAGCNVIRPLFSLKIPKWKIQILHQEQCKDTRRPESLD